METHKFKKPKKSGKVKKQLKEDLKVVKRFQNRGGHSFEEGEWSIERDKKSGRLYIGKLIQDDVFVNIYPIINKGELTGKYFFELIVSLKGNSIKFLYYQRDQSKGLKETVKTAKKKATEWLEELSKNLSNLAKQFQYCYYD